MSDTPHGEAAETTNVCPRCVERDAWKAAMLDGLARMAMHLLHSILASLMIVHWFIANGALSVASSNEAALLAAMFGSVAMAGTLVGAERRDRLLAASWLATWAIIVSASWAVVTWRMP